MAKDITKTESTTLPDPATLAFRYKTLADLGVLSSRTPNLYGSKYNANLRGPQKFDSEGRPLLNENGEPVYEIGGFERDPNAPLTAGTNADLTNAGQAIRDMQGGQTGTFLNAQTGIGNAAGMDIYGAGAPAYGLAGQYYNQAAGVNTAGQYQPYGAAATNLYGQSTDALGLSAASPYLQAAGQSSAQNINQYMNPYNEQVTNRIAQLGARNLSENILPSISSDFIKAGGYGSTRQRDLVGRAARDTQESILGQQAQALQQGYGQGLTASAADLARYGNLAGTAGSLGTQQQGLLQSAASGISGIGQAGAGFAGADAARMLAAGQGQAGIGAGLGNLMQANQQGQLNVGAANIDLANAAEASRLKQIAALQGVGESTEARDQRVIDENKAQVERQNAALFDPLSRSISAAAGTPGQATTTQSTTSAPAPSAASQIGSLAVGAVGAYNATKKAKGGAIKKGSLKKSSYGKLPKRGLGMFARAS